MERRGPVDRLGIVLQPHTHLLSTLDRDLCPQAHRARRMPSSQGSFCGPRAGGRATALLYLEAPVLPSPQGGASARESLSPSPFIRWRHNDTWWVLGAITRRPQRPLVG